MRTLYERMLGRIDADKLRGDMLSLYRLERGQTFPCYRASARKALEILQDTGIPGAELIRFPADGRTAYQDKIMPLGWDASVGKLTILDGFGFEPGTVAADFKKHPFHLIKGSVGTAPGGESVRILTNEQVRSGADAKGALVMIPPGSGPVFRTFIGSMLDLGARGFVSDFAMNAADEPDGIQWCNAFTERANWHVTRDDRPFIAFSVTPAMGARLRAALAHGEVAARIESDARRFETEIDAVTALLPGRRKEEFWILAHLYEPLSNDNSAGAAAAVETARLMAEEHDREFSLRLIFAMEYYGFAAYAARRGGYLGNEVLGGIDYDAMYTREEWQVRFRSAAPGSAFYGNFVGELLSTELDGMADCPRIEFLNSFPCMYDDDSFLSDSTLGVPIVWPIRDGENKLWHNSRQTEEYVERRAFVRGTALNAAFVASVIRPDGKLPERALASASKQLRAELDHLTGSQLEHLTRRYGILRQDLDDLRHAFPAERIEPLKAKLREEYEQLSKGLSDERPVSPWRRLAELTIPRRTRTGFPHDQANVPLEERKPLPGSVLYGPLAAVLADMDGKRDLAAILRMAEHETRKLLAEEEVETVTRAVFRLSRYGYLALELADGTSEARFAAAAREVGMAEDEIPHLRESR